MRRGLFTNRIFLPKDLFVVEPAIGLVEEKQSLQTLATFVRKRSELLCVEDRFNSLLPEVKCERPVSLWL